MSCLGRYLATCRTALQREHEGYSIRAVAKRAGLHHSYLSKVERGETTSLTPARLEALARELGEDPDLLTLMAGRVPESMQATVLAHPDAVLAALRGAATDNGQAQVDEYAEWLEGRKRELEELNRRLHDEMIRREAHEKALAESEGRLRAMFDQNPTVQLLIDPATQQIVDANPAACAFYGYDRASLCAMRICELNALGEEGVSACIARARVHRQNVFRFPHRLADGSVHMVESRTVPITVRGRTLMHSIIIALPGEASVAANEADTTGSMGSIGLA